MGQYRQSALTSTQFFHLYRVGFPNKRTTDGPPFSHHNSFYHHQDRDHLLGSQKMPSDLYASPNIFKLISSNILLQAVKLQGMGGCLVAGREGDLSCSAPLLDHDAAANTNLRLNVHPNHFTSPYS